MDAGVGRFLNRFRERSRELSDYCRAVAGSGDQYERNHGVGRVG